jgi:hypothetical protein
VKSKKHVVFGNPNERDISTSHVERQNLTMRMKMRRMTRLTNAFSKQIGGLDSPVALHFMHYNFCRVHQSLRVTPAMAAGIADHVWSLAEVVSLIDPRPAKRRPHSVRKRTAGRNRPVPQPPTTPSE